MDRLTQRLEDQDRHCPSCKCNDTPLKDGEAMYAAHKKVIAAMYNLEDVWDNKFSTNYPKYLPSFDEFIDEFRELFNTKEE
jgi:hypothetical protein